MKTCFLIAERSLFYAKVAINSTLSNALPLIQERDAAHKTTKSLGTKSKMPYFYRKKPGNDKTRNDIISYAPR